jgi:hypothetical protein
MKCGTTWMQHLVYQVLTRGRGDLVGRDQPLYSMSPWIEAETTVPVEQAPLIGEEVPSRIIKTHLPAQLCPYRHDAKYIYVVRHPVSCFVSCVDFLRTNLGEFAPDIAEIEDWFLDDGRMWWGTWPSHVRGWYERSKAEPNVLFVRFEDMKSDLPAVAREVARFIGLRGLDERELTAIADKCSFEYMQSHAGYFEMHPPHIINQGANLFVSGRIDRRRDATGTTSTRILEWCRDALKDVAFGPEELYPGLTSSLPAESNEACVAGGGRPAS